MTPMDIHSMTSTIIIMRYGANMTKLSDQWQTPDWLFKELDDEFHFNIDLCCNILNTKAVALIDDKTGGIRDYLNTDISKYKKHGNSMFMNPPYSNPKPFVEKAWEDSKHCKIVLLLKVDPSTKWWSVFWNYGEEITYHGLGLMPAKLGRRGPKPGCEVRFLPKRVKFDPPPGYTGKVSSPSFPSAIVIFDRRER